MTTKPRKAAGGKASNSAELAAYADKAPSAVHERCSEWLLSKTGYKPTDRESFDAGVRLAVTLYQKFQASPENKAANADHRAQRVKDREARAEASAARKEAAAAKRRELEERRANKPAKKAPGKKAAGKSAPAKKAAANKAPAKARPRPRPRAAAAGKSAAPF